MTDPRDGLPLVTAVIAVYNGQRYLREAIDSVLAQDYPALDLLIVDDGSTDDGRPSPARTVSTCATTTSPMPG
jgi:cellulose synthase/poly-beta-1,6-N-acetylglucosamine synthase-like glycosyltransferase